MRTIIERLWGADRCAIHRCDVCGFAFSEPFVGGDEAFYATLHEQLEYPRWRWEYGLALETVREHATGRALDVGAGVGMFLRRLPPAWGRAAVEGSHVTRRALTAQGIRVFHDLREAMYAESGSYDLVTMFQVLEHIAEFRDTLTACRALLRQGGLLVVSVPDGDAMLRQPHVTGEHDMPPNHVAKWTPSSLARVLRELGFVPGDPRPEPVTWRKVVTALHGRVAADATRPGTLAAQVYRVGSRRARVPLLALVGLFAVPRLLPHAREIFRSSSFALTATKVG